MSTKRVPQAIWVTPWLLLAVLISMPATGQDQICFVDDDGARWEIGLEPNGNARGSVQIPLGGCERGRVVGNYAFGDATFPLHLFVPPDLAACLPRSTLSGFFTLGAGGPAQIIVAGLIQDLVLSPCESAAAPDARGWWSGVPTP